MINLKPFDIARAHQPLSEFPFLLKQREQALEKKPYQGLRIVQNLALSIESICKLEPLILGGAEVTVTMNKAIHPSTQTQAIQLLHEIGIPFEPTHSFEGSFDYVLDCGAELAGIVVPRKGAVEITQSGSEIYKSLKYPVPVISVDDSDLKHLETFFGTGEGCVRALQKLSGRELSRSRFVIFGYGKVGQGICHFLTKSGAIITVVDIDLHKLSLARTKGYHSLHFKDSKKEIEGEISSADGIITATGAKNLISDSFPAQLFNGKVLANVGVEDEFGDLFTNDEVLFNKQPINFPFPTPPKCDIWIPFSMPITMLLSIFKSILCPRAIILSQKISIMPS